MKKEFEVIAQIIQNNKRVLDIGCGDGTFLHHVYNIIINKTLRGKYIDKHPLKIVGVDINKQGLELAEKFARSSKINNIQFIEHDILNLPFNDESFDFVFSKGALHHTGDLKKGLNEYSRVLKKGGSGFLFLSAD